MTSTARGSAVRRMHSRTAPPAAKPWWRRRTPLAAAVAAMALVAAGTAGVVLAAGSGDGAPTARPLTTDEADILAVVRFQNYRRGTLAVSALLPAAGGDVHLAGRVDFRRSIGSLQLRTDGRSDRDSTGLVQFTPSAVAFHPGTGALVSRPLPTTGWQRLPMRTDGSNPVDTLLALVLGLGTDRPENAQLLRQQGARWLRTDHVGGDRVAVFSGPSGEAAQGAGAGSAPAGAADAGGSRTRYWVDGNGLLRRFEARIGSNPAFARVTLSSAASPPFRVSSVLLAR